MLVAQRCEAVEASLVSHCMQARALQATTAALAAVLTAVAAVTAVSLTAVAAVTAVYSSRNSSTEQPALLSSILTKELYCSRSARAVPQRRLFIVHAIESKPRLPLRG